MSALLTIVISLLSGLLPLVEQAGLSSAVTSVVDKVISTLETIIPLAVSEVPEMVTDIQNIITTLKGSSAVTPAQFTALEAEEAKLDAAFNAAAGAAGDPAPAA